MNRSVIVVGAGDFGRELFWWFTQSQPTTAIVGFIDDNLAALAGYELGAQVISSISDHEVDSAADYVMGISNPAVKLKIASELSEKGARFINYIHPTVVMSPNVSVGVGVVLCPYAVVSCDAVLGDFSAVNLHSTVGHDVVLGAGCTLSAHVDLCGHVKVGQGAFFGSHASVLPKVQVGAFARVGAGSVAVSKVKEDTTVFGVPAKKI